MSYAVIGTKEPDLYVFKLQVFYGVYGVPLDLSLPTSVVVLTLISKKLSSNAHASAVFLKSCEAVWCSQGCHDRV